MAKVVGVRVPPPAPTAGLARPFEDGARQRAARSGRYTMQVTETLSEGLKREYRITVPAKRSRQPRLRTPERAQGQGPDQRLPSRQGAGRPPEAPVWPLGVRRGPAGGHDRGRISGSSRNTRSSSRCSRRSPCRRMTRKSKASSAASRSRLHGRGRGAAGDHGRRPEEDQDREAGGRRRRCRDRRDAGAPRRAEFRIRAEDRQVGQGREQATV